MATLYPFKGIRPAYDKVEAIAALPYDVYDLKEAKEEIQKNPLSFLQIDRGETLSQAEIAYDDPQAYVLAKNKFEAFRERGYFIQDTEPMFYIYELEREGHVQRGIVACVSTKEYEQGIIRKHENTRERKEMDRVRHIEELGAHTGPIFLAYRQETLIKNLLNEAVQMTEVIFEFTADDGVRHKGYQVSDKGRIEAFVNAFMEVDCLYIADGHHRAASAVKVARKYPENKEAGRFLAVAFADEELSILDYNRVVKDLNHQTFVEFIEAVKASFDVQEIGGKAPILEEKGNFGMFFEDTWYSLAFRKAEEVKNDPVRRLDASILQEYLLEPVLGIKDPKTDERIDFVGGIRGMDELERRVHEDMKIAFCLLPTSMDELMAVSDAHLLMPPKSTWFEPKLRSGLFIHSFKDK